jgi:hypothetical protein
MGFFSFLKPVGKIVGGAVKLATGIDLTNLKGAKAAATVANTAAPAITMEQLREELQRAQKVQTLPEVEIRRPVLANYGRQKCGCLLCAVLR